MVHISWDKCTMEHEKTASHGIYVLYRIQLYMSFHASLSTIAQINHLLIVHLAAFRYRCMELDFTVENYVVSRFPVVTDFQRFSVNNDVLR